MGPAHRCCGRGCSGWRPRTSRSSTCWPRACPGERAREPRRPRPARWSSGSGSAASAPGPRRSRCAARAGAAPQPAPGAAAGVPGAGQARAHRSAAGARGRAAARRAGRRRAGRAPRAGRCRRASLHAAVGGDRAARSPRCTPGPRERSIGTGRARRAGPRLRRDGHRARSLRRRGPRRGRLPALHPPPGRRVGRRRAAFTEEHSHATDHLLLPADPALLRGGRPLVLVDDELSTGRTALNTIAALHRTAPRDALRGGRAGRRPGAGQRARRRRARAGRPARRRRAGARTRSSCPADLTERAATLRAEVDGRRGPADRPARTGDPAAPREVGRVELAGLRWPAGLPVGGRHGFTGTDHRTLAAALPGLAAGLARAAGLVPRERTLVLGTEELMQLPLRLAADARRAPGTTSLFSTTTRSPAVVVDAPGLRADQRHHLPGPRRPRRRAGPPLRLQPRRPRRPAVGPRPRRGRPAGGHPGSCGPGCSRHSPRGPAARPWWSPRDVPTPLRAAPRSAATPPDEVGWLLTDLSGVALEAPTEEREEAIQSGGAHYAESLPQEYQPDAEYLAAVPLRAGRRRAPAGPGRRHGHRAGAARARARRRAGVAGPGGHPGRRPAAALGRRRPRPGPAALRGLDRARPGHRPARAAPPGRAPRPGAGGVRRRLDGQGRHRPRARRSARRARARHRTAVRPATWPCWPIPAAASPPSAPATTG